MKKILAVLVIAFVAVALVACNKGPTDEGRAPVDITDNVAFTTVMWENTTRFSSGFRGAGLDPYVSLARDPQGEFYICAAGTPLPVWRRMGELLNITFTRGANAPVSGVMGDWWDLVNDNPDMLIGNDFVAGSAANVNRAGVRGDLLNLLPHITAESMPNFYQLLADNPAVKGSLLQVDGAGEAAIYGTPYFDGFNEIEHMFLARVDWIRSILDADLSTFTFPTDARPVGTAYQPITPLGQHSYTVYVSTTDDNTGVHSVRQVQKSRDTNVIVRLRNLNNPTPQRLIEELRQYFIDTYGGTAAQPGQGYARWSDIFAGQDASYDTDEMMALMMVMLANPEFLNRNADWGTVTPVNEVVMWFPRVQANNRRIMYPRGWEIFGLRGVQSRNGEMIFFDDAGTLHDIRVQDSFFATADNAFLNLTADGIIPNINQAQWINNFAIMNDLQRGTTGRFGFLIYDFNATQTTAGNRDAGIAIDEDWEFRAILPPVVNWNTNLTITNNFTPSGDAPAGQYFHFTESTRAVRADFWGINAAIANDPVRLARALLLLDEMYNYTDPLTVIVDSTTDEEGNVTNTYVEHVETVGNVNLFGPHEYHDGTVLGADGIEYPRFSEAARERFATQALIDFARRDLGATNAIGHVRVMTWEFQSLSPTGLYGITLIGNAMNAGTFVLSGLAHLATPLINAGIVDPTANFFRQAPVMLPYTAAESGQMAATTWRNFTVTNNGFLMDMINNGFTNNPLITGNPDLLNVAGLTALIRTPAEYPQFITAVRAAAARQAILGG